MVSAFREIQTVKTDLNPKGRNSLVLGPSPEADTFHVQGLVMSQLSRSDPQGANRRVIVLDVDRSYHRYTLLLDSKIQFIEYSKGELPVFNKELVVIELEQLKAQGLGGAGGLSEFKNILRSKIKAEDLLVINEAWCIDPEFVMWVMSDLENEVIVTAMLESDLEKHGYDTSLFNGSVIRVTDLKL